MLGRLLQEPSVLGVAPRGSDGTCVMTPTPCVGMTDHSAESERKR